jgi:hypothetical protein
VRLMSIRTTDIASIRREVAAPHAREFGKGESANRVEAAQCRGLEVPAAVR